MTRRYDFGAIVPFAILHLAVIFAWFYPPDWRLVLLCILSYGIRMFGITAGYHRYFSHRSYRMGRVAQFCMAWLAQCSGQKGVLWWAAHHRVHHRHSDGPGDVHSPLRHGFWWSHLGWVLSTSYDHYDPKHVPDLGKFRELRWLDRWHWVPTVAYAATLFALFGVKGLVWGFVVSTVVLYHGTFSINSLAHLFGTRRFNTPDDSRNNWWLALITLGEGWHNNHHHFMGAARQGMRWWEIDITWMGLRVLSWLGIARDLRPYPPAMVAAAPR